MKTFVLKVRLVLCVIVLTLVCNTIQAKNCTICVTNSYGEQSLLTLNEYKPGCWTVTGTHDYTIWGGTVWPVSGTYSCITKKLHYTAINPTPDSCIFWANHVTFDYDVADMDLTGSFNNDCGYGKAFGATAVMGKCIQPMGLTLKQGEYGSTGSHKINRSLMKLPKGDNLNELLNDKPISIVITPNPAKQFAQISFSVEKASEVQAGIYDMQGNVLHLLTQGSLAPGLHTFTWNLKSLKGIDVPRGYYWLRAVTNKGTVYSKQLLVDR